MKFKTSSSKGFHSHVGVHLQNNSPIIKREKSLTLMDTWNKTLFSSENDYWIHSDHVKPQGEGDSKCCQWNSNRDKKKKLLLWLARVCMVKICCPFYWSAKVLRHNTECSGHCSPVSLSIDFAYVNLDCINNNIHE